MGPERIWPSPNKPGRRRASWNAIEAGWQGMVALCLPWFPQLVPTSWRAAPFPTALLVEQGSTKPHSKRASYMSRAGSTAGCAILRA
eukprot:11609566-Alexandrium_andersonii.AAC.1